MPRTPEAFEKIRKETSEKILLAAIDLFIKKGYHSTSIEEVTKLAQVSKGLLYHYYEGKEGLLAAMVHMRIGNLRSVMERAASMESPADQICEIAEGSIENVYRQPELYRFFLNIQTQPHQDLILAKYAIRLKNEFEQQFELQSQMFERLGVSEPRKRSLFFSSTLNGIMLMICSYPDHFPIEEMKTQVTEEFCS
ncbi:TetR/AcrR family transcriptional regulator [Bacillus sp. FJAT-42376]|uniref:TetR/AcrR family transcriptional regulator n=1 Tax=Bacillus sp. FJAT-42376 TaxID=2014076 RepID=UPI000F4DBAD6|nr:TetR/AcrR family transcriptional regulator [Bacillus sp. FJAT-42376]AZB42210.1 TetR/AcrR family transcriptional regulator [Bacillus sp. FJAT-42376]